MPINPADRQLSDDDLVALFTDPATIPERTAIALMYDEGVSQDSVQLIRDEVGLYVTTVQEQGLTGERSDYRVLAHARRIACTLVTGDKVFRNLHRRLLDLRLGHAGILYVSFKREPEDVLAAVRYFHERAVEKDAPNILHYGYWRV